jgi:hypothetical protein
VRSKELCVKVNACYDEEMGLENRKVQERVENLGSAKGVDGFVHLMVGREM